MFGISKIRKRNLKSKTEVVDIQVIESIQNNKELLVTTYTKAYIEWNPKKKKLMIVLVATNGKKEERVYENTDLPLLRYLNEIFSENE